MPNTITGFLPTFRKGNKEKLPSEEIFEVGEYGGKSVLVLNNKAQLNKFLKRFDSKPKKVYKVKLTLEVVEEVDTTEKSSKVVKNKPARNAKKKVRYCL